MIGPDTNRKGSGWPVATVILIVLLVQFSLQAYFFPLAALSSPARLTYIDAPFHQYQMELARELCDQGRLTGFDPYFAAGQPGGINLNASAKIPALLGCLADSRSALPAIYKQVSFWSGVMAPVALTLTCLLLRMSVWTTALVALWSIILWWTGPMRWYHTAGMTSYVLGAFAGVPLALAAVRVCIKPTAWRWAAVAVAASLGMFLHPLFLLGVALAGLPGLVLHLRDGGHLPRVAVSVAMLLAVVLTINGFWIWETVVASSYAYGEQPYQRAVEPFLAVKEMLQVAPTAAKGSRLYIALLIGTVICLAAGRTPHRRAMMALASGGALLMAWASVSAAVGPLGALQPNRFSAMAWLCLVLPAAEGTRCAWAGARRRSGGRRWALTAIVLGSVAITALYARELVTEVFIDGSRKHGVARPEVKGMLPFSNQMVTYLKDRTDQRARIYFELSLGRKHDGGHLAALYAWDADREFIGGPYPFVDFANAWDDSAFGRPLTSYTTAELTGLLDGYNIGWMICHSDVCKATMSKLDGVVRDETFGPVVAYRRLSVPGFVAQGRAEIIDRCVNRLAVRAQGPEPIVLRYHWVPGLRSFPPAVVEPVAGIPGDRPLIRITNPPASFVLSLGHQAAPACPSPAKRATAIRRIDQ